MAESKAQAQVLQQESKLKETSGGKMIATHPIRESGETMHAVAWKGKNSVEIVTVPRPMVTQPDDAVVRVTATTICGSDLHLYRDLVDGMKAGDILGHEFMGFVEDVGANVKDIKRGDRVVVCFDIADGSCAYCKKGCFSACQNTNPSKKQKEQYGHNTGGIFGYSHLTGGFDGGQAEYVRVPYADVNCLKVTSSLPDEKVFMLSDVIPTAWHANELGKVKEGDNVAIWGCGPVGLMAIAWAKFRGARTVIAIDNVGYRLDIASGTLGAIPLNFDNVDIVEKIKELIPDGPDVCIDCAGFEYSASMKHKLQRALHLEHDSMDIINQMITVCRPFGRLSIIGVYVAQGNMFQIGAFMEKGLTMSGSQTPCQKYWKKLLEYVESGQIDPTFLISHKMPLEEAVEAYKIFSDKEQRAVKIMLLPRGELQRRQQQL